MEALNHQQDHEKSDSSIRAMLGRRREKRELDRFQKSVENLPTGINETRKIKVIKFAGVICVEYPLTTKDGSSKHMKIDIVKDEEGKAKEYHQTVHGFDGNGFPLEEVSLSHVIGGENNTIELMDACKAVEHLSYKPTVVVCPNGYVAVSTLDS